MPPHGILDLGRCSMDTIKLWARNGDAVRQAIELGELVHLDTASEELTDEFLLFAMDSGLLKCWATSFPDPRQEPEISMEVLVASQLAARFAGRYSMRQSGYVLRSASVLGAMGQPFQGSYSIRFSWSGFSQWRRGPRFCMPFVPLVSSWDRADVSCSVAG